MTQHVVTVQVQAYGAEQMQMSNDASLENAAWGTYRPSRQWQMQDGFGDRQVYVRVVYAGGDTSAVSVASVVVDRLPVADAGVDQVVEAGTQVELDGTGSHDPDGDALTYRWSAPPGVTLSDSSSARPTCRLGAGAYVFTLIVTNGHVESIPDRVTVISTQSPVADAGVDQVVEAGTQVELDGTGSHDPDGDALTYRWSAPPGVTLSDSSSARPTCRLDAGAYVFTPGVQGVEPPAGRRPIFFADLHPPRGFYRALPIPLTCRDRRSILRFMQNHFCP